jgi:hypothetical protein
MGKFSHFVIKLNLGISQVVATHSWAAFLFTKTGSDPSFAKSYGRAMRPVGGAKFDTIFQEYIIELHKDYEMRFM